MRNDTPGLGKQAMSAPIALWTTIAAFSAGLIVFGALKAETVTDWAALVIVTLCSLAPVVLWISRWRDRFPILPAVAFMHVFHYGLPYISLSSAVGDYDDEIKLGGALSIGGFLLIATAVWATLLSLKGKPPQPKLGISEAVLRKLLPLAMLASAFYTLTFLAGTIWALGEWASVLRAICMSLLFLAAYVLGALWSQRKLGPRLKIICMTLLVANVILLWASLYLYAGVFVVCVGLAGYVVGGGRVPVVAMASTLLLVTVLHAGKAEMRERYWTESAGASFSVTRIPLFMLEWAYEGSVRLVTPAESASLALTDRTGLMHMLLRVQRMTPDIAPYLGGETYAMLPRMLVPRVIDPDKPQTRDAAIRLNLHYGLLSEEESESTSIGWGLAPEAYANFGDAGIVGLGLLVGLVCGWLTRWIRGAPPFSGRLMIGIVIIAQLVNLEGDMATVVISSFHGLVAVFIIGAALRLASSIGGAPPKAPGRRREHGFQQ